MLSNGSGFTRSGYTLSRWDTSPLGTGTSYSLGETITMPAGGLILRAVWTQNPVSSSTSTTTTTTTSTTTTVAATTSTTSASGATTSGSSTTSTIGSSGSTSASLTTSTVSTAGQALTARVSTTTIGTKESTPAGAVTTTTGVATPLTTTTSVPSSEEAAPDVEQVVPGGVGATIGGSEATVEVNVDNGSLVVNVGGGVIKYSIVGRNGVLRTLAKDADIRVGVGDRVQVDFSGFGKDAEATAWINPGNVALGSTTLSYGTGVVEGVVEDSVGEGARRIAVATETAEGKPLVVAYGVTLQNDESTGPRWSFVLIFIVGLAVVGALLIPAAWRRRDDQEE